MSNLVDPFAHGSPRHRFLNYCPSPQVLYSCMAIQPPSRHNFNLLRCTNAVFLSAYRMHPSPSLTSPSSRNHRPISRPGPIRHVHPTVFSSYFLPDPGEPAQRNPTHEKTHPVTFQPQLWTIHPPRPCSFLLPYFPMYQLCTMPHPNSPFP